MSMCGAVVSHACPSKPHSQITGAQRLYHENNSHPNAVLCMVFYQGKKDKEDVSSLSLSFFLSPGLWCRGFLPYTLSLSLSSPSLFLPLFSRDFEPALALADPETVIKT